MTTTLTRRNRDSLTLAEAERYLLAAFPEPGPGTCIAHLNRNGFHATVVLAHAHVHQIVMLSRRDAEDGPLRTVSVKTGFHRNHEYIDLDIAGAVHIAERIAHDVEHAGDLAAAGSVRWAVTR